MYKQIHVSVDGVVVNKQDVGVRDCYCMQHCSWQNPQAAFVNEGRSLH